ncbi:MAG: hypothetical protein HC896_12630 [Bacteroidales bacterium]|nr:hypothetical protein [Bacteroidales bacterium]
MYFDDIEPGEYYLVFKADSRNTLFEDNESNNVIIKPLKILPGIVDIRVNNLIIDNVIGSNGSLIQGQYNIYNAHSGTCDTVFVEMYLRSNLLHDETGGLLLRDTIFDVDGSIYSYSPFAVQLPDTLSEGLYYLVIKALTSSSIREIEVDNNMISKAIAIQNGEVDFEIDKIGVENPYLIAGYQASVSCVLINNGTMCASTLINYFLSADSIYDVGVDIELGSVSVANPLIQTEKMVTLNMLVPDNITHGNYVLIAVADPKNTTEEANEGNNVAQKAIAVTKPGPDFYY